MFHARDEKVTHRITLPLPAGEALELFTPEGKRQWIAEWRPRYQYPANGETLVKSRAARAARDPLAQRLSSCERTRFSPRLVMR